MENQTNKIIQNNSGWFSLIFELDKINPGGLLISYEDFINMEINLPPEIQLRFYRKTGKVIVSSSGLSEFPYVYPKLAYVRWKCQICKKINLKSETKCFCGVKSFCWSPIDPEMTGVHFANDDFNFHFQEINVLNIID